METQADVGRGRLLTPGVSGFGSSLPCPEWRAWRAPFQPQLLSARGVPSPAPVLGKHLGGGLGVGALTARKEKDRKCPWCSFRTKQAGRGTGSIIQLPGDTFGLSSLHPAHLLQPGPGDGQPQRDGQLGFLEISIPCWAGGGGQGGKDSGVPEGQEKPR